MSDNGVLTPIVQGVAVFRGPLLTVDRAGDLVAAGMPFQDAGHAMGAFYTEGFSCL